MPHWCLSFFHDFALIILVENSRSHRVSRSGLGRANGWERIWHRGRGNLVTEDARSGLEEFATGMLTEFSSLSTTVFLIDTTCIVLLS